MNPSGRTAIQKIRGTRSYRSIGKFGDKLLYMPLKLANHVLGKLDDRVQEGIFWGTQVRRSHHWHGKGHSQSADKHTTTGGTAVGLGTCTADAGDTAAAEPWGKQ